MKCHTVDCNKSLVRCKNKHKQKLWTLLPKKKNLSFDMHNLNWNVIVKKKNLQDVLCVRT